MNTVTQPATNPEVASAAPLYAGVAHSGCQLLGDSPATQRELNRRFWPYRLDSCFREDRQLRLSGAEAELPHLEMVVRGQSYNFDHIASGPEWKRFVRVPHPSRRLLADSVLGPEPALEVMDENTAVLQPTRWPLYAMLAWHWLLLQDRSLCTVHAAVTAYQGEALVLISASGTGKSTLAHALGSQGADYFTDEAAWFSLPEFRLYPLLKDLCLRPGGMNALGLSADCGPRYEAKPGDPKHVVALTTPEQNCPENHVHLVFLEGFAAEPALRPLPGSDATRILFRHLGFGSAAPGERLQVAASLVNRYPCYGLRVGSPAKTAELLLRQVEGTR